ncbi:hypothetical protein [Streptomyces alfalfae]
MAYVNHPVTVLADHEVATEELVAAVEGLRLKQLLKTDVRQLAQSMGVQRRRFSRPLESLMRRRQASLEETITNAEQLGACAARQALDAAGLCSADLDGLIVYSTDARVVQRLAAHIAQVLGRPLSLAPVALADLGAAGGAQALTLAADDARLGRRVLVVGAEAPSTALSYGGLADAMEWCVAKLLCNDGAAAALVSPEPLAQPSVYIEDVWQLATLDPDLAVPFPYRPEAAHTFDATPKAIKAITSSVPRLPHAWQKADFGLVHPGSTAQLETFAASTGCTQTFLDPARVSLAEDGNTGGSGVLHVLQRMHAAPPPIGASGLLFASGPGFYTHAARLCWVADSL